MSRVVAEVIGTGRLTLWPLREDHAEEMARVLADPALHTFIGGTPADPQALRARYRRLLAGSTEPDVSWCNWVVELTGAACLVGTVQATITQRGTGRTAEIAWVVGTPWQRRGIGTEAARGLVDWLRQHRVVTVVAHIHPGHRASEAVARAAGLTPTTERHDGEVRWQLVLDR